MSELIEKDNNLTNKILRLSERRKKSFKLIEILQKADKEFEAYMELVKKPQEKKNM